MNTKLKKRSIIAVLFILVIFLSNSYRFSPTGLVVKDFYDFDYTLTHLDEAKNIYNSNLDKVPNFAKSLFGDEKMKVIILRNDKTTTIISIETKNGEVLRISNNKFEEYTLEVKISEETINEITTAHDQVAKFKQAIDDKKIIYDALRFKTSIKVRMAKTFLKLFSWFG